MEECGIISSQPKRRTEINEMEQNKKILIADENGDSRKKCRDALTRAGYHNVDEAYNGEDALIFCLEHLPAPEPDFAEPETVSE